VLRTLGLRAYRRAGAGAPVGGRFTPDAERHHVWQWWTPATDSTVGFETVSPFGPKERNLIPAAHAALAK
jgi:hypothetical protein